MAKRQRHVFPTNEIPHLWAHQTQSDARNPGGNLYFSGPTIYSYGDHFPIASFHVVKNKRVVLMTTATYSHTTAQHCSAVRQAIPKGIPTFNVGCVLPIGQGDHQSNLNGYITDYNEAVRKGLAALHLRSMKWRLDHALHLREEGRAYAKTFGLKIRFKPFPSKKKLEPLRLKAKERQERSDARQAAEREKQRAAWAERERLEKLALPEKIEKWRQGASVYFGYGKDIPCMLRLSEDKTEVETSLGARVPIDHARMGLRVVRAIMRSGKEYVHNGHSIHLGHYRIDKITMDGTLYAGCHVIKWDEIERLAPQLETEHVQEETVQAQVPPPQVG